MLGQVGDGSVMSVAVGVGSSMTTAATEPGVAMKVSALADPCGLLKKKSTAVASGSAETKPSWRGRNLASRSRERERRNGYATKRMKSHRIGFWPFSLNRKKREASCLVYSITYSFIHIYT
ncbi:hypothetical protein CsSME_00003641 [Camellia sinensis var. sinensis]